MNTLRFAGVEPGSRFALIDNVTGEVLYNEEVEKSQLVKWRRVPSGNYTIRFRKYGFKSFEIDDAIINEDMNIFVKQIVDWDDTPQPTPPKTPRFMIHNVFDHAMQLLLDPDLDLSGFDIKEDE